MAYQSTYRFARISPSKMRRVVDLVRGQSVSEAIDHLKFVPNRGARMLEKVIKSAVANAEDKGARRVDDMVILEARVDEGPRMKRIQPRARGMAYPILKRFSHIHVVIDLPQTAD